MNENHLDRIEQLIGFKYPQSFHHLLDEFKVLCSSPAFKQAFPLVRPLLTESEVTCEQQCIKARERLGVAMRPLPLDQIDYLNQLPNTLIPFMRDEGRQFPDAYAFDLTTETPEYAVIVWTYADTMIVQSWKDFSTFFQWLREFITSPDGTAHGNWKP
jgi:hypothetical protein